MRLGPSVVSGPKADHTADRCWSFVWLVVAYWLWPGFTGWESQWIWAHQSMDDNLRLSVFLQLVVPFKVPRCAQTLHWDQNNDIPQSPRNKECFRLQGCFLCWDDRQARATQLSRKSETWFTTSDDFGSSYSGSHKKFSDLVPVCSPWLSCQKTWLFYLQGSCAAKIGVMTWPHIAYDVRILGQAQSATSPVELLDWSTGRKSWRLSEVCGRVYCEKKLQW